MKQAQIIKAYKTIQSLSDQTLPIKVSYALYKILNVLKEQFDFQVSEEKKIMNDYFDFYDQNTNNFVFDENNKDKSDELISRIKELNDIDVDLHIVPVVINSDVNIELSMEQIKTLEGIVAFE